MNVTLPNKPPASAWARALRACLHTSLRLLRPLTDPCATAAPCLRPSPARSAFQTPDEELKKIVLKGVKQCVGPDGVEPDSIRTEVGGCVACVLGVGPHPLYRSARRRHACCLACLLACSGRGLG